MNEKKFFIGDVSSVMFGERSDRVFLFIHGKGGNKKEARRFYDVIGDRGYQVIGIDIKKRKEDDDVYPWVIVPKLKEVMEYLKRHYKEVSIRANSIGAYFAMLAFCDDEIKQSLFVSPIVDMEKLIKDMMKWANVTEDDLRKKKKIYTDFNQILSYEYLIYVREHKIKRWNNKTSVLYAENDNLTDINEIKEFTYKHSSDLKIMENGEHYFHTSEQLEFLKNWERSVLLDL